MNDFTEADALLVMANNFFNSLSSLPARGFEPVKIKFTYDAAAKIDEYLRGQFGKNAHELIPQALKALKKPRGRDGRDGKLARSER